MEAVLQPGNKNQFRVLAASRALGTRGFPKIRGPFVGSPFFGSPCKKGQSILGSMLGPLVFGNSKMCRGECLHGFARFVYCATYNLLARLL